MPDPAKPPAKPPATDPGPGPAAPAVEHPQDMLCFALYAAEHAMGRIYRPLLEPLGLTYPQYLVLMALGAAAPLSLRALGDAVALESNTLTPLLKRMERAGLLTRRRNPQDERALQVALTPAGRALRARAKNVQARVAEATGMRLAELADLRDRITALRRNLDQALERAETAGAGQFDQISDS